MQKELVQMFMVLRASVQMVTSWREQVGADSDRVEGVSVDGNITEGAGTDGIGANGIGSCRLHRSRGHW